MPAKRVHCLLPNQRSAEPESMPRVSELFEHCARRSKSGLSNVARNKAAQAVPKDKDLLLLVESVSSASIVSFGSEEHLLLPTARSVTR